MNRADVLTLGIIAGVYLGVLFVLRTLAASMLGLELGPGLGLGWRTSFWIALPVSVTVFFLFWMFSSGDDWLGRRAYAVLGLGGLLLFLTASLALIL